MATQAITGTWTRHQSKTYSGLLEWITTTDHKKIGIMYLLFTVLFFFVGGLLALLVRTQLAWSDNDLPDAGPVQPVLHHARLDDALPLRHPGRRRLR